MYMSIYIYEYRFEVEHRVPFWRSQWITSALEQWEQRHKITRELVKYECDPTDVAKNDSCPTATPVRNP